MPRVSIVEDNLEILEMLLAIMGRYFETESFDNGRNALRRIREAPPDLAILDVNVPGVDGFSLCKLIKDDPQTSHVKIIILTAAHADEKGESMAQAAGADAFLLKPIRSKTLLEKAHDLLGLPFAKK